MFNPRRSSVRGFFAGAAIAMLLSVAAASRHTEPGWEYGRSNCGPRTGGSKNSRDCIACCYGGARHGRYPAESYGDCQQFCLRAMYSSN